MLMANNEALEEAQEAPEKAKHKYFPDQFDDEEVLFVFHKHPIVMRKGLILGMAAWLIGPVYTMVLTYVKPDNPPSMAFFGLSLLVSILIGGLILVPSWISWHFSTFVVTNQRFLQITQKGFWHRAVADINLPQIQSINYEISGLQETLLGFGTIKLQTYLGDVTIKDVHHPAKTQKRILSILREQGINTKPHPVKNASIINQTNEETQEDN
jgi:membrane protein YdbS with pleckstrin-like domain